MDLDLVEHYLKNNNRAVIEMLDEIADLNEYGASTLLLSYYEQVKDHGIRNHIALALSDLGCSEMVEPTVRLITKPRLRKYNGTLIYALAPFDCSKYFDVFFELLFSESFEARNEAVGILSNMLDETPEDDKLRASDRIEDKIHDLMVDVLFYSRALGAFRDRPDFALHHRKYSGNKKAIKK